MLTTRERIITSQELARQVHVALANAQQEPLVVTEKGTPAAYLISVDLFDKLLARLASLDNEQSSDETRLISLPEAAEL